MSHVASGSECAWGSTELYRHLVATKLDAMVAVSLHCFCFEPDSHVWHVVFDVALTDVACHVTHVALEGK